MNKQDTFYKYSIQKNQYAVEYNDPFKQARVNYVPEKISRISNNKMNNRINLDSMQSPQLKRPRKKLLNVNKSQEELPTLKQLESPYKRQSTIMDGSNQYYGLRSRQNREILKKQIQFENSKDHDLYVKSQNYRRQSILQQLNISKDPNFEEEKEEIQLNQKDILDDIQSNWAQIGNIGKMPKRGSMPLLKQRSKDLSESDILSNANSRLSFAPTINNNSEIQRKYSSLHFKNPLQSAQSFQFGANLGGANSPRSVNSFQTYNTAQTTISPNQLRRVSSIKLPQMLKMDQLSNNRYGGEDISPINQSMNQSNQIKLKKRSSVIQEEHKYIIELDFITNLKKDAEEVTIQCQIIDENFEVKQEFQPLVKSFDKGVSLQIQEQVGFSNSFARKSLNLYITINCRSKDENHGFSIQYHTYLELFRIYQYTQGNFKLPIFKKSIDMGAKDLKANLIQHTIAAEPYMLLYLKCKEPKEDEVVDKKNKFISQNLYQTPLQYLEQPSMMYSPTQLQKRMSQQNIQY